MLRLNTRRVTCANRGNGPLQDLGAMEGASSKKQRKSSLSHVDKYIVEVGLTDFSRETLPINKEFVGSFGDYLFRNIPAYNTARSYFYTTMAELRERDPASKEVFLDSEIKKHISKTMNKMHSKYSQYCLEHHVNMEHSAPVPIEDDHVLINRYALLRGKHENRGFWTLDCDAGGRISEVFP